MTPLFHQKETDQSNRFSVIVNDLKTAETVQHKTALMTLINCIINTTPDTVERNRIRNEFIGRLWPWPTLQSTLHQVHIIELRETELEKSS